MQASQPSGACLSAARMRADCVPCPLERVTLERPRRSSRVLHSKTQRHASRWVRTPQDTDKAAVGTERPHGTRSGTSVRQAQSSELKLSKPPNPVLAILKSIGVVVVRLDMYVRASALSSSALPVAHPPVSRGVVICQPRSPDGRVCSPCNIAHTRAGAWQRSPGCRSAPLRALGAALGQSGASAVSAGSVEVSPTCDFRGTRARQADGRLRFTLRARGPGVHLRYMA